MNRLKLALSFAALGTLAAPLALLAQPAPPPAPPAPPADAGRTISRDEARAGAERLFAAMDLNGDGRIDAADREVELGRMFDRIDANHDGSITRAEFVAAHRDGGEHGGPEHGPGHGPGPEHGPGMRMRAMGMGRAIMQVADPQHTGSVDRAAFVNAALVLFDRSDANHDGKVTPEERRAAMMAMRGGEGGMHRGMRGGDMDRGGDGMTMPPPPGE